MSQIQIDWDKYFKDSRSLPLESTRNPKNGLTNICTSKRALETYIKMVVEAGKEEARLSGQTYGSIEKSRLEANLSTVIDGVVDDDQVYQFNPEFYAPYVTGK